MFGCLAAGIMVSESFAQSGYFEDALRFSQFRSTGSARITGMGGAQMSLGGDISNIHGNPAGLGFFRRSEFSISPAFTNWNSETNYLNQVQAERTGNIAVPNLGVVLSNVKDPLLAGNFKGGSFGISFNRLANFNNQFGYFSEVQGNSSLLDFYVNQYNSFGEPPVGAPDGLPLDILLIQGSPGTGYNKDPDYALGNPFQDETVIKEGGISQTTFAYGANFNHKLYFGGSLGIQSINYFHNRIYNEEFFDDNGISSLYYSIEDNKRINGLGVNVDIGLIYKPVDQFNLGINFKSPTWYRLNQEFDANIVAELYDIDGNIEFSENGTSDIYINTTNLSTPLIIGGGFTYFIGKNGFITADVDYLDYSTSRLNSSDFNPSDDNQEIITLYGNTLNYRIGGEYRFNIFRIRGGYGYYGDPFVNSAIDRSSQQISGGLGVRLAKFYVDFAVSNTTFNQVYSSYSFIENGMNIGPLSEISNNLTSGILTVGFNF